MSVKGMMQAVLVTELKQIQQDISDTALKYVVDNFSQMWDVREILAEEVSSLQQSNGRCISALERMETYLSKLEGENKALRIRVEALSYYAGR